VNETMKKDKGFFLTRWAKRLFFGGGRELSFMEEEALQSPMRTIIKNFFSKPLSRIALGVFIAIFLFVIIGPLFMPLDLSYQDNTQKNVAPGLNMMSVPRELESNLRTIAPGTTFGAGLDKEGKVYTWGYTRITETINLAAIPPEVREARMVDLAVGYDHAVSVDEEGKVYVWGNTRLDQAKLSKPLQEALESGEPLKFKQLEAGNQFSAAVTEDGRLFVWGNSNLNDVRRIKKGYDTNIKKVTTNINTYLVLTNDGEAAYVGTQSNAFSKVPEAARTGVVDIASTGFSNAALKEDGSVIIWGNPAPAERELPPHEGKLVRIWGGRNHYVGLTDSGQLIAWGNNTFNQSVVPALSEGAQVVEVFSGYYQNYMLDSNGKLTKWGLKGYLLGTDHLGRDILNRIVNGGRVTMTVGAISVVISLIIGVIIGGLAGYFGSYVDLVLMRVAEIVGGLPFLPFALILSAIIGSRLTTEQRVYLIMFVLGILSWPGLARLVRAQILATREMEFVTAAKAMGVRENSIVFRHIIPNVISVIIVNATLSFASAMLIESTLSYLGFGISPPTPTWGNMLTGSNNSIIIQQYWWRWVFPAIILSVCTICINLIGDGLRDAIDPKSAER